MLHKILISEPLIAQTIAEGPSQCSEISCRVQKLVEFAVAQAVSFRPSTRNKNTYPLRASKVSSRLGLCLFGGGISPRLPKTAQLSCCLGPRAKTSLNSRRMSLSSISSNEQEDAYLSRASSKSSRLGLSLGLFGGEGTSPKLPKLHNCRAVWVHEQRPGARCNESKG